MDPLQHRNYNDSLYAPKRRIDNGQPLAMPTTGIVVSADDPLDQGRLRVACTSLRDDVRNPESIPWAVYCSPFIGTISNESMVRGADGATSTGGVVYGMWAIPEIGAEVMITTLNGNPNARVWTGCIPRHQGINGFGHGRYVWAEDALPDGPFTNGELGDGAEDTGDREKDRLQPLYDNLTAQFQNRRSSAEWRTRGAELPGMANKLKSRYTARTDQSAKQIADIFKKISGKGKPLREHEAKYITEPGYGWSGVRSGIGDSSRVSRVYGITTPGMHSLTMDDRHGNSRIRLRSTAGSQILIDDTNERMYFSTAKGDSYFEMDWNGNLDFFGNRRMSFHAVKGFNFTTDETYRVHAKKGIHLFAGPEALEEGDQNEAGVHKDGQIRLHAQDDIHLFTDTNLRTYSKSDTLLTADGNMHLLTQMSLFATANSDMHLKAVEGNIATGAGTSITALAGLDILALANNKLSLSAKELGEINVINGKLNVAAGDGALVKVMGKSLDIQAIDGDINFQTPNTNVQVGKAGILGASTGEVLFEGTNSEMRARVVEPGETTPADIPPSEDCASGGPFPMIEPKQLLKGKGYISDYEDYAGPDNMARALYNAGFRGAELVSMLTIAGTESNFGTNVVGSTGTDSSSKVKPNSKWEDRCLGAMQIRVLKKPPSSGLDAGRNRATALNMQESAVWSRKLFEARGPGQWSSYYHSEGLTSSGKPASTATPLEQRAIAGQQRRTAGIRAQAQAAYDRLCGSSPSTSGSVAGTLPVGTSVPSPESSTPSIAPPVLPGQSAATTIGDDTVTIGGTPTLTPPLLPTSYDEDNVSVLKLTSTEVRIQGRNDIFFKTTAASGSDILEDTTTSINCMRTKVNDIVGTVNKTMYEHFNTTKRSLERIIQTQLSQLLANHVATMAAAGTDSYGNGSLAALISLLAVADEINGLLTEVNEVVTAITAFSDFAEMTVDGLLKFPQTEMRNIERMFDLREFDMGQSKFLPPEISQLASTIERTFLAARESGGNDLTRIGNVLEGTEAIIQQASDLLGIAPNDPISPATDCPP
jgi:Type VI secretion system/phage-baseplate injector OB domain